jgi:predicted dehydrogenase
MNILVIGLGSMGKRRIRLLKKMYQQYHIYGVDLNAQRCAFVKKEYEMETFPTIEEAVSQRKFECAFVCTSPLTHAGIIKTCLENDMNVFTELNLVSDDYVDNINLAKQKNKLLFLSSTMIYRDEMKYLRERIDAKKRYSYTYHVGQYLPDWHPWENYKDFFVADKKTNACREILAIELPWIVKTFGEIEHIKSVRTKATKLDIDYDDSYMILLQHKSGTIGSLCVDVVSCEPIRSLKIVAENLYLSWDGDEDSFFEKSGSKEELKKISLYDEIDHLEGYNKTIIENEYANELIQFFDELQKKADSIYNFEDDLKTLSIIDEVEK